MQVARKAFAGIAKNVTAEGVVNGIEYALGWIPAGGYVALPQMASMEAIEGKSDTPVEQLPNVSPLDKICLLYTSRCV